MKIALKLALTGLFVAGVVALSAGSLSAQEVAPQPQHKGDGGNGNSGNGGVEPHGVPLVPLYGHPYASQTSGGEFFLGTIDFEFFELDGDGGQITLVGRLLTPQGDAIETVFPVEILDATCEHVLMDIGPPPVLDLQDPLHLNETQWESQMRHGDFCTIAHALQDGDLQAVVDELNEVEELEAGLIGENSCPWYTYIECGAAIAACGASCAFGPEICLPCFAAIVGVLAEDCVDCVLN